VVAVRQPPDPVSSLARREFKTSPGLCALNRQKPQSPSLRSRINDDRTFRCEKSAYLRVRHREHRRSRPLRYEGTRRRAIKCSESQGLGLREPNLGMREPHSPLPTPYSSGLTASPSRLLASHSSVCTSAIPVYCFIPCICL